MLTKVKIKKGDKITVLSGKNKGKSGKVLLVDKARKKIVVEGVNLLIKHVRPRRQSEKGQRIQFPAPLHISKVALLCPKCSKQTRIGWEVTSDKKLRKCKKCKQILD